MAKEDRGTKREDPETGKKFYDLNKDPIVSPYTGKSYPRSYFESATAVRAKAGPEREVEDDEDEEEVEVETAEDTGPEIVSLEDADAEESGGDEEIPDVEDVEDVEDIGEDDSDVFLEEDEDEDEDLDFDVGGGGDER
ncbi:MAG TPA: TIGR02300 family protein [Devosia sp.]